MSSGNLIRHSFVLETEYGVTPAGDLQAISKTSTAFTGTPDVTSSQTIRDDRLPSGNIVTGLTVTGNIANELSRTIIHDTFIEACMMNTWDATPAPLPFTDLAFVSSTGTLSATSGLSALANGDVFTISGLTGAGAPFNLTTSFVVTNAIGDTSVVVATGSTVTDWSAGEGGAASIQAGAGISIGITPQRSYTFEKRYLDLTAATSSITYLGEIFSAFSGEFNYGSPVTITYDLQGAGKVLPTTPLSDDGRAVIDAPTENFMNPSTAMPMLLIDGAVATYCVEGITLSLDNGLSAKNCVGQLNKAGYDLGTAAIEVGVNAHFSDSNYAYLQRILDQDTVEIEWSVIDSDGYGYHFSVSCQLTGDDPDVESQDAQAMLALTGSGAIGTDGLVLTISKLGGDLP